MKRLNMNQSAICQHFGFDPENLVETLTASFVPFLEQGVEGGVLSADEVEIWTEKIRTEFSNRVSVDPSSSGESILRCGVPPRKPHLRMLRPRSIDTFWIY